jgi:transcriptional regulator with XRE-family HTH domain
MKAAQKIFPASRPLQSAAYLVLGPFRMKRVVLNASKGKYPGMTKSGFAEILKNELSLRKERNPRYSLRSFASYLELSPAFLSKVLSGKKSLSSESFLKIAAKLNLEDQKVSEFFEDRPHLKPPKVRYELLAHDQFQWIADWHHYAILEAVQLADFQNKVSWLAERLQIPVQTAAEAVERLSRLGLLDIDASGQIQRKPKNHSTAAHPFPPLACREHERQVLQKAIQALDQVPVDQRDQTSLTMAIPKSRYKKATQLITKFRQEMAALAEVRGKKDAVFNLSVSFYPVTAVETENT